MAANDAQVVLKWIGSILGRASPGHETFHRLPIPPVGEIATIHIGFWDESGELFYRSDVDEELGECEGSTVLAELSKHVVLITPDLS